MRAIASGVFCFVLFFGVIDVQAESIKTSLDDQTSVSVTVYNSNIGLVKDTRHLTLAAGGGELDRQAESG